MSAQRSTTMAVCLLAATAAHAHHSFAIYDADDATTLRGVVEKFRWTNPHTLIVLKVENEDGTETLWELEHAPINMLSRQGWTNTTLEPGDAISVEIHPLHSGQFGGRFMDFEFLDARPSDELAFTGATILNVPRPEPVEMSDETARNFNGIWVNANGGIHFDTTVRERRAQKPPLKPEYMAQWLERQADADAGRSTRDPTAECLPAGFPRFLSMVFPGEILQAEHQLNWYAEWGGETVRIYLDGRDPPEGLAPSYTGYSTGAWDGNTLVTRTIGLRGDTLIDTTGVPHSEEMTVTMRMRKLTPDFLEVEVTLEDPVVFYEPWSTVKRYVRASLGDYIREFVCLEGNRYRINPDGEVEVVFDTF